MFAKEINNTNLLELRSFELVSLELSNIIFNAYLVLGSVNFLNIKLKYLG